MNTITELCFLCTKDYNCVPVDDNIMCQVKFILPEIINITLGIPLRICFVCNEALYAFSKFKQISVDNILRLEARIKGAPGPLQHTGNPHIPGSRETSHIKPEEIEQIIIKEEPLEPTTRGPQLHTNRATPGSTPQLQTPGAPDIQQHTHTQQLHKVEEIVIKVEPLEETLQDQVFDNNMYQNILKEEYNDNTNSQSENKMATPDTSEEMLEQSFSDPEEENVEETEGNCSKNTEIDAMKSFFNTENPKKEEHQCNICKEIFIYQDLLIQHLKEIHGKTQVLPCTVCNKLFTHKNGLQKHMKLHTGMNKLECCVCKKEFSGKFNLKRHLELHSDLTDFYCGICNETFPLGIYLKSHITHKKTREKEAFFCNICNKSFDFKCYWEQHMKIHTGEKDFHCEICNKSFTHKTTLVKHLKIHSGIKDFHCDICSKSFTHKFHLVAHRKTHSGVKDVQCETCNKFFTNKSHLAEHMKLHLGIKDYKCETCDKSFTKNSALVNHMKSHLGIKDFQCDVCTKSFVIKADLVRHRKTHFGIKDFQCEICSKSFAQKSSLVSHVRVHTDTETQ